MLIANDMALITFLPLGYFALHTTGKEKYMAYLFILQNISAILGGMLTPFGNPQNLYLYSKFEIPDLEFIEIMFPPFIIAISLITVLCLVFVKAEPLEIHEKAAELPLPRVIFHLNALRRHCLSPTAQACEALTPVDTDPYRASALSV